MKRSQNQISEPKVSEAGAFIRLVAVGSIFILLTIMMIGFLSGCSGDASFSGSTFNFPGSGFPNDTSMEWILPEDAGWSSEELQDVHAYAIESGCQAVIALYDGKVFFSRGNIHKNYPVGPIREALLNALYGIHLERDNLSLDATLEDLNIDDSPPGLTPEEKQAEVEHLLMSRSGVYHEAANEKQIMIISRPERGSHPPDTFFYHNNWDVNTLGNIFEQETGEDICEAFKTEIVDVVGMVDFLSSNCSEEFEWDKSMIPAFEFTMSARDLAKFGVLYQKNGFWKNSQVIQNDWIDDSTISYSIIDDITGAGYGYLWKVFEEESELGKSIGYPGYYHNGAGGDVLVVIPDLNLVMVVRYLDEQDWDEPGAAGFELTQLILDARLVE